MDTLYKVPQAGHYSRHVEILEVTCSGNLQHHRLAQVSAIVCILLLLNFERNLNDHLNNMKYIHI